MCQLLGMNANVPTDISFSFAGFRRRGGHTDHHSDGFGIAFFEPSVVIEDDSSLDNDVGYTISKSTSENNSMGSSKVSGENISRATGGTSNYVMSNSAINKSNIAQSRGKGLRLFHDDKPSFKSPIADLVNNYPIKALNVVSHIRKATQGHNCLANTHPFVREVWGEQWVFAHNGQMNNSFIQRCQRLQDNGNGVYCHPVGTTDSEMAFCYLINRLKSTYKSRPSNPELFKFLTTQCRYLAANGLFNCLLSNGDWQLAYANSLLFYLTRKAPFGNAKLSDDDLTINFGDVTTDKDKVTIIVTIPLTDNETWQQLAVNECMIFQDGDIVFKDTPSQRKYLSIEEGIAIAREVGASV